MSNSKISALTSATTPVAGTEVLPIVQSSATVKLAISDLTPGLSTITAAKGGTGQTSYAVGDLLYADTTTTLAKLPDVATGNALISGGVSTAPSWGKIGLTTHISGTLAVGNGGTGLTSLTQGYIPFGTGTTAYGNSANLFWDSTNNRLGLGTTTPRWPIELVSPGTSTTGLEQTAFFRKTTANQVGASILVHDTLVAFGSNAYAGAGNVGVALLSQAAGVGTFTVYGFPSGGVSIGNTTDPGAKNLSVSGTVSTGGYTVATLPAGVTGARVYVTDALAPAFGAAVVGGGAVTIPVFFNGAIWIVG